VVKVVKAIFWGVQRGWGLLSNFDDIGQCWIFTAHFYVVFWQPFWKWQTSWKFWKCRIAPLMVTYHYVKIYVSIIIQLGRLYTASTLPTGTPGPGTTPNPCGANSTQCISDQKCIPNYQVCDFTNQCADASDSLHFKINQVTHYTNLEQYLGSGLLKDHLFLGRILGKYANCNAHY
jgi:hypothetical protein